MSGTNMQASIGTNGLMNDLNAQNTVNKIRKTVKSEE